MYMKNKKMRNSGTELKSRQLSREIGQPTVYATPILSSFNSNQLEFEQNTLICMYYYEILVSQLKSACLSSSSSFLQVSFSVLFSTVKVSSFLQSKILHYMRQMAVITPYAQFAFRFSSDSPEYSLLFYLTYIPLSFVILCVIYIIFCSFAEKMQQ